MQENNKPSLVGQVYPDGELSSLVNPISINRNNKTLQVSWIHSNGQIIINKEHQLMEENYEPSLISWVYPDGDCHPQLILHLLTEIIKPYNRGK